MQKTNGAMGTSSEAPKITQAEAEAIYRGVVYRATIPPRYQAYTLSQMRQHFTDPSKIAGVDACRELAKRGAVMDRGADRYCLMLAGGFGTGKTTLATAAIKELAWERTKLGEEVDMRWLKFYDFVRSVQSGYGDGTADEIMRSVQRCSVLLLDDVGDLERGAETDNKRDLLYQVVDFRNDYLLPTVFTSNLLPADLATQFGQRTFERIMEMCAFVEVGGQNLRMSQ